MKAHHMRQYHKQEQHMVCYKKWYVTTPNASPLGIAIDEVYLVIRIEGKELCLSCNRKVDSYMLLANKREINNSRSSTLHGPDTQKKIKESLILKIHTNNIEI